MIIDRILNLDIIKDLINTDEYCILMFSTSHEKLEIIVYYLFYINYDLEKIYNLLKKYSINTIIGDVDKSIPKNIKIKNYLDFNSLIDADKNLFVELNGNYA